MKLLKALFTAIMFLLIGLSFYALVVWELRVGVAAGTYGGAKFAEAPGIAWFIVAVQVAMGTMFLIAALTRLTGTNNETGKEEDATHAPANRFHAMLTVFGAGVAGLVMAVGAWAAWDMGVMVVGVIRNSGDDMLSRVIVALCLCASVGVFVVLLFNMVIQPLCEYWAPRVRAALAYLRSSR